MEKLQGASEPGNENDSQEIEDTTTPQDEDTGESLKERKVGTSVGNKKESLPQSTQEVLQQHKLVFHDVNTVSRSSMCILHIKNEAQPSFLKRLRGVWISDETHFRVFDMASQMINNSWRNLRQNFMVIRNTYPNHGHSSDFLCFLLMNYK